MLFSVFELSEIFACGMCNAYISGVHCTVHVSCFGFVFFYLVCLISLFIEFNLFPCSLAKIVPFIGLLVFTTMTFRSFPCAFLLQFFILPYSFSLSLPFFFLLHLSRYIVSNVHVFKMTDFNQLRIFDIYFFQFDHLAAVIPHSAIGVIVRRL